MSGRLKEILSESWYDQIGDWFQTSDSQLLMQRIKQRSLKNAVYPIRDNVFNAFKLCPYDKVKVVILGQDPYPYSIKNVPVAHGLAFSSNVPTYMPPSLATIFQELDYEYDHFPPYDWTASSNLERWASQGVLLLNTSLTVDARKPGSHSEIGWTSFIDKVLDALIKKPNIVFMLWGSDAKSWSPIIQKNKTAMILKAAHPNVHHYRKDSHLDILTLKKKGGGFLGCDHFKKANEFLERFNKTPIQWIESDTIS